MKEIVRSSLSERAPWRLSLPWSEIEYPFDSDIIFNNLKWNRFLS